MSENLCRCGCGKFVKKPGAQFCRGHHPRSPETLQKMSIARKGIKVSEETKDKISKAGKGRPKSEEMRRKLSESKKGVPRSEETKAKLSNNFKGRKHTEETIAKMREAHKGRKDSEETIAKRSKKLRGKPLSEVHRQKISNAARERLRNPQNNPNWKGGIHKSGIPSFETYAHQLDLVEQVRKSPEDNRYLQVRCTYCGKWIIPTLNQVSDRISAINGKAFSGECRFYCPGTVCRSQCSLYHQRKYPKGYKYKSSELPREVQPQLRKLVFERDKYTCQKCSATEKLHCHHTDPVINNPVESADLDKCITLCKACHIEIHKKPGCKYSDLKCD